MLVTFERLVAIRFTIHYPFLITEKNVKIYVAIVWIIAFCSWVLKHTATYDAPITVGLGLLGAKLHYLYCYFLRDFVPRNASP